MLTKTKTWGGLAAAGALLVALTGCGSDAPQVQEPSGPGTTPTGSAPIDTGGQTEGTEPQTDPSTGSAPVAGQEVDKQEFIDRLKSVGDERLGSFEFAMNIDMQGEQMTMTGKADMRGSAPAMDMEMDVAQLGKVHLIMADGKAYMSMPGMTPDGKFVAVPIDELQTEGLDPASQVDMTKQWDAWETGAQKVTFVGTEDVEGEQLDHYTLTIDAQAALDAGGQTPSGGVSMPPTITYDVWVDKDNLMRKITFDIGGATTKMTMKNWGEDVNITAPSESEILEMPGLIP